MTTATLKQTAIPHATVNSEIHMARTLFGLDSRLDLIEPAINARPALWFRDLSGKNLVQ
jgi:hypothetical protein